MITHQQIQSALTELYTDRESLEQDLKQVTVAIDGLEALMHRTGGGVTTQADTYSSKPTEKTQSVGMAIEQILRRADGFITVAEIKAGVANASPPVHVKSLNNAIYATLSRNTKHGKYVRQNGQYRWPSSEMRFN